MKYLSDNLFRKDLNLERRWWHRLAKIFFVILSIFVIVGSIFGFYSAEEDNARQYKIIKNFGEYVSETRKSCIIGETNFKAESTLSFNSKIRSLSCYIFVVPSFLSDNTLKDYSLGCLIKNGKVEHLSEFSFKDDVVCGEEPDYNCTIPKNICGGIASNIVRYDYEIKYGFYNYFSIAVKTLSIFLGWILLTYLIYYKALLYIIFGGEKHTNNSHNH